jgi:hypothetical protein
MGPGSQREKGAAAYPFGSKGKWAAGRTVRPGLFTIFFALSFSFSIFIFYLQ